jgi:hypothetical protein
VTVCPVASPPSHTSFSFKCQFLNGTAHSSHNIIHDLIFTKPLSLSCHVKCYSVAHSSSPAWSHLMPRSPVTTPHLTWASTRVIPILPHHPRRSSTTTTSLRVIAGSAAIPSSTFNHPPFRVLLSANLRRACTAHARRVCI